MGLNREIGYKNQLIYHFPNDLKRFKELTTNHIVVMGRKTFQSIGKLLPNRINVILTHNKKFKTPLGGFVYHSFDDVVKEYKNLNNNEKELWIIGGESIYRQSLPYADYIYLTIIEHTTEKVDTFFPEFDLSEWKLIEHIKNKSDEKHPYDYHFVTYKRR